MTVDPGTLQATAIERLTTGPGLDTEFAVSADGKRLAFTGEAQHTGFGSSPSTPPVAGSPVLAKR